MPLSNTTEAASGSQWTLNSATGVMLPSPVDPPSACRFHTRCPWATEICSEDEPPLADYGDGQAAACHHPRNVDAKEIAAAQLAPDSPASASDTLPAETERVPAGTR